MPISEIKVLASSIFSSTPSPTTQNTNDPNIPTSGVELGMKFQTALQALLPELDFGRG
jgi:hypothetical protein